MPLGAILLINLPLHLQESQPDQDLNRVYSGKLDKQWQSDTSKHRAQERQR